MEKRAFKRRTLRLKGVCSAPGAGSRVVEIQDFCSGGMLLSFQGQTPSDPAKSFDPVHGDIVDIRCNVPSFYNYKPIVFRGRVVRLDADGVGLVFIDPDPDALLSLHDFAKQRSENEATSRQSANLANNAETGARSQSDIAKRGLLEGCRRMTQEGVESLIEGFLLRATPRFLNAAEISQNIAEKNAFYAALSNFDQQRDTFKSAFALHVNHQLNLTPEMMGAESRGAKTELSRNTLSLVEDDVFEEWLAFSDMARKTESVCQEQLSDLAHRVGVLFHAPIDKENNPFGPVAFGKAFQEAIRSFGFAPKTLHVVYAIYRDELIVQLGTLYDNLNDYLIKNGVLADLKHKYRVKRAPDSTSPQPAPEPPAPSPVPDTSGAGLTDPVPAAVPEQDWYRLVQNINDLQKQVAGHGMRPAHTEQAAITPTVSQEPLFFTPEELILALSNLGSPASAEYQVAQHPQAIRSKLISVLTAGKSSHEQKQLPGREEKILDMAGNLLESVLTDKLISNNVRPWLQQLSIPVFKMAINDESIFTDKSHLVRQVINAIAQLEFYGAEDGDQGQQVVTKRIDSLLAEIAAADPLTPKVFGRVLRELSLLISVQNKAYEENLQEVLTMSAEEHHQTDVSEVPTLSLIPGMEEDEALREWRKCVRRLKVGDSLLIDAVSKPRRLTLAWISDNRRQFVFVNVKGLRELTLSKSELAFGLRSGKLTVLDDGGDSLLDRAQYSMLQKMHAHLLHETTHDQLTGLINRREFERRLNAALASARQGDLHHVICYIDLTQFTVVNNTFGYDGGDRLLSEIAELFDSQLGDRGVLARIGGDEFGLLLETCTTEEALTVTTRYKEAMHNYRFSVEDKSLAISFSVGLVTVSAESDSVVTLLQAAEASCRVARGKGSNYVQVFDASDAGLFRHMEVLKWASKIDEALDNESLDLRFQPIVGIKGEGMSLHHAEILLGLLNDEGELISPADFVLAAEHFRRMAAVDRWVIERAFRWMGEHSDKLAEIGGLAINLSGSSLNEEGFVEFILTQAEQLNVPMDKVCFEITETAGIANLSNASEFILTVKKTGCQFALDDFGSGLSSYAYLKNLPVDFLKIDGMFIKNMDSNPYDYAVVKSITEIGHFMGKEIIAEFVENEGILNMLREIGVDYAQGYAIAKPKSLIALGRDPLPQYKQ